MEENGKITENNVDQTNDQILDIPELPEEPHSISLEAIAPKPAIKKPEIGIMAQKVSISSQESKNISSETSKLQTTIAQEKLEPLPQTRAETIKPLVPEPHKIARTPSEELFSPHISTEPVVPKEKSEIPEKKLSKLKILLIYLGIALGSIVFVYLFLNFPAIWSKMSYRFFGSQKEDLKITENIQVAEINSDLLFLNTVYDYPPVKYLPKDLPEVVAYDNAPEIFSYTNYGYTDIGNNEIIINKLGIRAPIIWDVPTDDATLMDNLKHGLVHYKGTAKPGEMADDGNGNIFLAGHSSYYWWDDGKYKTVFANLDGLTNGDEIIIKYKDYYFLYKVIDKKVVNPEDVGVLAQNTSKPILSLMTCVPVGTDAQRLIVTSELVGIGKQLN